MTNFDDALRDQRLQAAERDAEQASDEVTARRTLTDFIAFMKTRNVPPRSLYRKSWARVTEGVFHKREYTDYTYTYVGACWLVDETDGTYYVATDTGDYVGCDNASNRPTRAFGGIRNLYPPAMEAEFRAGRNVYVARATARLPHASLLAERVAYAARVHLGELGEHHYRA